MPKADPQLVRTVMTALVAAHPEDYPFPDMEVMIERILWSRYFCINAWARVGKEWDFHFGWMHNIGRDRRNQKEMKLLLDAGKTHYQGFKIQAKGEPYIERWTKEEVWDVFLHVQETGLVVDPVCPWNTETA